MTAFIIFITKKKKDAYMALFLERPASSTDLTKPFPFWSPRPSLSPVQFFFLPFSLLSFFSLSFFFRLFPFLSFLLSFPSLFFFFFFSKTSLADYQDTKTDQRCTPPPPPRSTPSPFQLVNMYPEDHLPRKKRSCTLARVGRYSLASFPFLVRMTCQQNGRGGLF